MLLLLFCTGLNAQRGTVECETTASIDSILHNPGMYEAAYVTVVGNVEQYVPATSQTTSYYLLQSDYGNPIRVNTADPEKPVINGRYCVSGTIFIATQGQVLPFISEREKVRIVESGPDPDPDPDPGTAPIPVWIIFLVVVIVLIVVLVIVLILRNRTQVPLPDPDPGGGTAKPSAGVPDLKTIKVKVSPPTMRLLPGKLEIISDCVDKGKKFQIAARPSPEGNIVTIGRDPVQGDMGYSHIHLAEYQTVSRKQAQIIERSGSVYIKNMGTTNPTQVNGTEIDSGTEKALNPGDEIRLGELVLKYLY